jgi:hypothetical protein
MKYTVSVAKKNVIKRKRECQSCVCRHRDGVDVADSAAVAQYLKWRRLWESRFVFSVIMKQNQVFTIFSIGLCERFRVCAPPPITLQKLLGRITQAIAQIDENTLEKVWHEFDYRIDVCWVTCGAHIEGL